MSNVKGLDKLLKNIDSMPKEVRKIVDDVTFSNALEIERNAKRKAPINKEQHGGFLRQSIHASRIPGLPKDRIGYAVFALADYAAYMEFGTGGLVRVPAELRELAIKFKGRGVKRINLKPQPYLYPSLVQQRPRYIKDLEDNLQPYLDTI